jgi:hypothetical protein
MTSAEHPGPTHGRVHDATERALETHWTRVLYRDADEVSAAERIGGAAWTVARVVVALLAAYAVVYLAVAAVVYAATTPEIATAFVPDGASSRLPAYLPLFHGERPRTS